MRSQPHLPLPRAHPCGHPRSSAALPRGCAPGHRARPYPHNQSPRRPRINARTAAWRCVWCVDGAGGWSAGRLRRKVWCPGAPAPPTRLSRLPLGSTRRAWSCVRQWWHAPHTVSASLTPSTAPSRASQLTQNSSRGRAAAVCYGPARAGVGHWPVRRFPAPRSISHAPAAVRPPVLADRPPMAAAASPQGAPRRGAAALRAASRHRQRAAPAPLASFMPHAWPHGVPRLVAGRWEQTCVSA